MDIKDMDLVERVTKRAEGILGSTNGLHADEVFKVVCVTYFKFLEHIENKQVAEKLHAHMCVTAESVIERKES